MCLESGKLVQNGEVIFFYCSVQEGARFLASLGEVFVKLWGGLWHSLGRFWVENTLKLGKLLLIIGQYNAIVAVVLSLLYIFCRFFLCVCVCVYFFVFFFLVF